MIRQIGNATLYRGLCLEFLRDLNEASVDAIVCDPPYGLSFMGKKWDYDVPSVDVWRECLRVLKPGGHLLAFAGTRTQHRMAVNIEDAGFEIRDMIAWVYGSGFPKSRDVSKDMDRLAGVEREVVGKINAPGMARTNVEQGAQGRTVYTFDKLGGPISEPARRWQGWGTALKPALEPITMARKPLVGTVAENVLRYGTGGLNIDGCRVGDMVETWPKSRSYAPGQFQPGHSGDTQSAGEAPAGRWPANLIHDGSDEVVGLFPERDGAVSNGSRGGGMLGTSTFAIHDRPQKPGRADSGSAARFFYCAKASKADRDEGLDDLPEVGKSIGARHTMAGPMMANYTAKDGVSRSRPRANTHPTVKPTDLMRYLCRLVTPPGGTVLDPFMGSGSTGKAAALEGFRFIGCERESEYFDIACRRIERAYAQGKLFQKPAPKSEQVPMWG